MKLTSTACCCFILSLCAVVQAEEGSRDLSGMSVIGNSELPKTLVIVPWKPAQSGDLSGRPVNSLLDEAISPVDREVFEREVNYYHSGVGR